MRGYQKPYVPGRDREARLESAVEIARFAVTGELHPEHRKLLCKQAAWFATECDGKLTPRYRTPAAMAYSGSRYWSVLRHEHVLTLASLAERMVAEPHKVAEILRGAVACLVTKEEHDRLTVFDRSHNGWDRYRAAGVVVIDAATGETVVTAIDDADKPPRQHPASQTAAKPQPLAPRASGAGPYTEFWDLLGTRLDREHPEWRRRTPQRNWQPFPGPVGATAFQFDFSRDGLRHQLLLASGDAEINAQRLAALQLEREALETAYGATLRFEAMDGRAQARVADYLRGSVTQRERWPEFIDWFVSSGQRLRDALMITWP